MVLIKINQSTSTKAKIQNAIFDFSKKKLLAAIRVLRKESKKVSTEITLSEIFVHCNQSNSLF